jgi:hypothetical protein
MLADRGTCSLTLDNNSGKYSSRNPSSPYYGFIGRNTPLRVSVAYGAPWLDIPSSGTAQASTPDAAVLDITGDIDIRVDAEFPAWGDPGVATSFINLITKYGAAGQRSWYLGISGSGQLVVFWTADGTTLVSAGATVSAPFIPNQRASVRATLDVDNGASGNTVTFYTSTTPGTAGPWTQLGDPVVQSGTTSLFNSTTAVQIGRSPTSAEPLQARKVFAAEVRNGIGGTVVANPNFEAQTPGATSFADTAPSPRTWTVTTGALTNKYRRFTGEVSSWPPQWDTGGKDVTTPIRAAGILQRYGQGQAPIQSTLRRRIPSPNPVAPTAYWPMEEGSAATQAASPLTGVAPLRTAGLSWASDSTLPGSAALPQLSPPSSLSGAAPPVPVGDWNVEMVYKLDTLPAAPTLLFQVNVGGGTGAVVQVLVGVAVFRVQVLAADGSVLSTSADVTPDTFTAGWGRLKIFTQTSGGTVSAYAQWIIIGTSSAGFTAAGYAGTPGRVTSVSGTWGSGFSTLRLGHLTVFPAASTDPFNLSDKAFDGETAAARLSRLASEQGIPLSIAARASDTEAVGPQTQDTILNVLQAAAQADEGFLYEAREFLGLRYRGPDATYNQASALDLPYIATPQALMAPLLPVDDDQGTKNDVTVTRLNGSSARSVITDGPLSSNPPPAGVGIYDDAVTLNLHTDEQAAQHASWRSHLGTWDEARFPQVNVWLEKNPALIPAVARIDTGSRMRITPPLIPQLPPDAIDQLVLGYTETIAQYAWRLSFACAPYGPWKTGILDDGVLGRLDTDGSTLAASATSGATTLSVATTTATSPLWTPDPAETPFDVKIAGEVVTVTTVGTVLNTNPYFPTSVAGWTGTNASILWNTGRVYPGGGAVASLQITPNGTSASGGANCALSGVGTVTPGAVYTASAWAYCFAGLTDARMCIDWYDSAGVFLSSSLGVATTLPAATWTMLRQDLTAPASASQAVLRARHGGTPPGRVQRVEHLGRPPGAREHVQLQPADLHRDSLREHRRQSAAVRR